MATVSKDALLNIHYCYYYEGFLPSKNPFLPNPGKYYTVLSSGSAF